VADIITLTCPKCGGKLEITPDIERFACAHCGNEHLVRRGIGVVTLAPVIESMNGLRRATDRTAAELAIRRVKDELAGLDAAKAETEARLAPLRDKLAQHDKWQKDARSMRLVLGVALLFLVGYIAVEVNIQPQGNLDVDTRLFCAYPLLGTAGVFTLAWILGWYQLKSVLGVKPPRPEVEAAIQAVHDEIQVHEGAKRAKQAELDHYLEVVRTAPVA
jgi:hypothetical protein